MVAVLRGILRGLYIGETDTGKVHRREGYCKYLGGLSFAVVYVAEGFYSLGTLTGTFDSKVCPGMFEEADGCHIHSVLIRGSLVADSDVLRCKQYEICCIIH